MILVKAGGWESGRLGGMMSAMVFGLTMTLGVGAGLGQTVDVPAGQKAVLTAEGRGVQIYTCKEGPDGVARWTFSGPEAKLFVKGVEVGVHGAGPVWTYMSGTVHGKMVVTQASPERDAVPWLLVKGVSYDGTGPMATVTYIQRTETKGGKAKTDGCDTLHLGESSRVPYSATYTFYAAAK